MEGLGEQVRQSSTTTAAFLKMTWRQPLGVPSRLFKNYLICMLDVVQPDLSMLFLNTFLQILQNKVESSVSETEGLSKVLPCYGTVKLDRCFKELFRIWNISLPLLPSHKKKKKITCGQFPEEVCFLKSCETTGFWRIANPGEQEVVSWLGPQQEWLGALSES